MNLSMLAMLQTGIGQAPGGEKRSLSLATEGHDKLDFLQTLTEQLGIELEQSDLEQLAAGQEWVAQYQVPLQQLAQDEVNLLQLLPQAKQYVDQVLPDQLERLDKLQGIIQQLPIDVTERNQWLSRLEAVQDVMPQLEALPELNQEISSTQFSVLTENFLKETKNIGDRTQAILEKLSNFSNMAETGISEKIELSGRSPILHADTNVKMNLDNARWGEVFNQRIILLTNQKIQTASIQLDPPDLGPLDVRIQVDQDKANIVFTSQHAAVRDAVEQALPRLRDMLQDTGLQLTNADVASDHSPKQQDTLKQNKETNESDAETTLSEVKSTPVTVKIPKGLVDTYA